jgi:4-hydroxybenzoate polyprenyltransferase
MVLGAAFGWSIPMAYAAETNTVPLDAFWLYLATFLWVLAYDTQYAMVDRSDDLKIGVKSTAILFGKFDCTIIFIVQVLSLVIFLGLGLRLDLGLFYYLGCFASGLLIFYQQHLIKGRTSSGCFQAFLNNNYFGAFIFIGLILDYLIKIIFIL